MADPVIVIKTFAAKHRLALRLILAAAALVFLIAMIVWFVALPQYRPSLRPGEVYGIDVSMHQSPLDWKKVAADDIKFVYIKATEGSTYQDERFKVHYKGAKNAGLRVGAYHYFSLCSPGRTQAENFVKTIPPDSKMLPPVLDLEFSPFCAKEPARGDVIREIDEYVEIAAKASGKQVMFYVGDDFDKTYRIKQHYANKKYWQLRYLQRPTDRRDYVWQVGSFFKVDGAPGRVDLNVGRIGDL